MRQRPWELGEQDRVQRGLYQRGGLQFAAELGVSDLVAVSTEHRWCLGTYEEVGVALPDRDGLVLVVEFAEHLVEAALVGRRVLCGGWVVGRMPRRRSPVSRSHRTKASRSCEECRSMPSIASIRRLRRRVSA